jgi:peptidoglycan hydrolase-like protein with peptidoglycan-binding domain
VVAFLSFGPAIASAAGLGEGKQGFGKQTLALGMHNTTVLALQRDLAATGVTLVPTGTFTRATVREVREFQRKYHLQVDGVVGPATWRKLERLLSPANHIAETAPTTAGTGGDGVSTTEQNGDVSDTAVQPGATGGIGLAPAPQNAPIANATLVDGLAVPAPGTPATIVQAIDAANQIAVLPYIYGGGHGTYTLTNGVTQLDAGYDCSGSVSFALHGGGFLREPLDSGQFASYGEPGVGNWITIYTNGVNPSGVAHVYMEIAGLWFDTAAQSAANGNDRWSTTRIHEPDQTEYQAYHPAGW